MASDIAVEITTQAVKGKKGLIDGVEFYILGPDQVSPDDETTAMALFSRAEQLSRALSNEPKVSKGKLIAERLRETQFKLFGILTSLSPEQVTALHPTQRLKLMEAIEAITLDEDDEAEQEQKAATTEPSATQVEEDERDLDERFGGTDS